MHLLNAFAVILLISSSLGAEQDVLEFTDADFSSKIEEYDTVLVMFYAPW